MKKYPCPCCECLTLPLPQEQATAFLCPVCFWENDVFTPEPDATSAENHGMTLREGRQNFRMFGACYRNLLPHVRAPKPEEIPTEASDE